MYNERSDLYSLFKQFTMMSFINAKATPIIIIDSVSVELLATYVNLQLKTIRDTPTIS